MTAFVFGVYFIDIGSSKVILFSLLSRVSRPGCFVWTSHNFSTIVLAYDDLALPFLGDANGTSSITSPLSLVQSLTSSSWVGCEVSRIYHISGERFERGALSSSRSELTTTVLYESGVFVYEFVLDCLLDVDVVVADDATSTYFFLTERGTIPRIRQLLVSFGSRVLSFRVHRLLSSYAR
jgi:hypothetical protein